MTEVLDAHPSQHDDHKEQCECVHCGLDYEFELPNELVDAAHVRRVVIFAGAGVSTEVPSVFPVTVMQSAANRLGLDDPNLSFPDVMQQFEDRFGRRAFVQMVKAKFDFIDSLFSLSYTARMFHRELATMPYLQDIVTTNWDTYFEEECAATPFVTGKDIALWTMPGRRVLKMHGSMTNLGSIVATEKDYKKRLKELRKGVMGGLLTELLTTRTIVFVGYSLRDWNFRRLYKALRKDMGPYSERAYFVSPFGAEEADVEELGLIPLKTSGVKFLKELKKANLIDDCYLDDSSYDRVSEYHDSILDADAHAKRLVSHKQYPSILYCWSFHDGAREACSRIANRRGSGEYSRREYVRSQIKAYEALAEQSRRDKRFWDEAYIEGYVVPLYLMLEDRPNSDGEFPLRDAAPHYFMYGCEGNLVMTRSVEEFDDAVRSSNRCAPNQRKVARERTAALPEGMVMEHSPFLPGLRDEDEDIEDEHA